MRGMQGLAPDLGCSIRGVCVLCLCLVVRGTHHNLAYLPRLSSPSALDLPALESSLIVLLLYRTQRRKQSFGCSQNHQSSSKSDLKKTAQLAKRTVQEDGMGWDGMGWDGMGWDGMGWDGVSPIFKNKNYLRAAGRQLHLEVSKSSSQDKATKSTLLQILLLVLTTNL